MKKIFTLTVLALLALYETKAQQVIGQFPGVSGGFENSTYTTAGATANTPSSTAGNWTSSGGGGGTYAIGPSASATTLVGRSGNNFYVFVNTSTSGSGNPRQINSPAVAAGAVTASKNYIITYWYKADDNTNLPNPASSQGHYFGVGVSTATGSGPVHGTSEYDYGNNPSQWVKRSNVVTSASSGGTGSDIGFFSMKFGGKVTHSIKVDVDDLVAYLADDQTTPVPDVTAPPSASLGLAAPTANPNELNVSWTASADVDGGGYMVVKYTVNPVVNDAPNVNGIYVVNNTITQTNTGKVVYLGTGTSFVDTDVILPGNNYYYRIYTVDKAYNYSTATLATNDATILPITLNTFFGKATENGALLNWTTASEQNNQKFEIYSSTDGKTFGKLGEVAGAGNSTAKQTYSFLDKSPVKGNNYYKLKQVDFNGNSEEFIIAVNYDLGTVQTMIVYPNPAKDIITVSFAPDQSSRKLKVISIEGKVVLQSTIAFNATKVSLNVTDLKSGQYIVEISGGVNKQISKFVK